MNQLHSNYNQENLRGKLKIQWGQKYLGFEAINISFNCTIQGLVLVTSLINWVKWRTFVQIQILTSQKSREWLKGQRESRVSFTRVLLLHNLRLISKACLAIRNMWTLCCTSAKDTKVRLRPLNSICWDLKAGHIFHRVANAFLKVQRKKS